MERPRLYDLEVERVSDEIRRRNARRVLLQLPDGLRPGAFRLARALRERTDAEVLLLGDSCYGACDVALRQSEAVEADLLVHYGHSRMLPDRGVPVLYVEAKVDIEAAPLVE
ncbi:MAG: diphthamide synthesis protein, partial [Candidatus Bathyarchaeota archaeon]|nr:diphthamide synthesis protein [Candidatus Bathyarchaeota archaeon]